jgi:hypothetical protein
VGGGAGAADLAAPPGLELDRFEKVRFQGWRVEIHLKIPLEDDGDGGGDKPDTPTTPPRPSSDMGLKDKELSSRPAGTTPPIGWPSIAAGPPRAADRPSAPDP